jgi:hypothetical protein
LITTIHSQHNHNSLTMQLLARSAAVTPGAALARQRQRQGPLRSSGHISRHVLVCHVSCKAIASKPNTHSSMNSGSDATASLAAQAQAYLASHAAPVNQPCLRKVGWQSAAACVCIQRACAFSMSDASLQRSPTHTPHTTPTSLTHQPHPQYAEQEAAFDALLVTPDLDRRLAAAAAAGTSTDRGAAAAPDNRALLAAAHTVEAAVAGAARLAFSSAPPEASFEAVGPCLGIHSQDKGCIVDWDSESLWDNAAASVSAASLSHDGHDAGGDGSSSSSSGSQAGASLDVTAAHTFLQRLLYKINRLNHFWCVWLWVLLLQG